LTLVSARGVARRYGTLTALAPTDVELHAGESLALVGPNGAGKSTLLAILAGALAPSEGVVERREGLRVGWVPQRPAHYGRLSGRENLELFARLEREGDPRAAATDLLAQFALPDDGRPSAELSVGNRQRLNVALSLLGSPDVLLLDEPTASLDPGQRRRLWETLAGARADGGAICFATQNLEELERFADRVVVLQGGAVAFTGTPREYEESELEVFH
jgi:ABC-type multidrug transport system ATPase subunit